MTGRPFPTCAYTLTLQALGRKRIAQLPAHSIRNAEERILLSEDALAVTEHTAQFMAGTGDLAPLEDMNLGIHIKIV